ncbi:(2Fe-2S)-binding protein [Wenzhouxiangella sp. AB-CW3]|uniref:(2Fe-2S)-binding protein n=1 Tax=Wenzhouxiangella sp. AB-CW3 TaxID=2771012 RepID=UPI00168ACABB|nr:(2Fe-2S)-binding protein [Wenzhouxiangella sp. AB-CW3]QOC21969.1 (2Fe-2S)-binding protein [Wenzhouxiangella sp. AB-CW3]
MSRQWIHLTVNSRPLSVPAGTSVAAAIARLDLGFRRSVRGQTRMPLCGMGVCFECRVRINGRPGQRACMVPVTNDMCVEVDAR